MRTDRRRDFLLPHNLLWHVIDSDVKVHYILEERRLVFINIFKVVNHSDFSAVVQFLCSHPVYDILLVNSKKTLGIIVKSHF